VADTFTDTVTGNNMRTWTRRCASCRQAPIRFGDTCRRTVVPSRTRRPPTVPASSEAHQHAHAQPPGAIPDSVQSVLPTSPSGTCSVRSHDIEALDKAEFDTASHVKDRVIQCCSRRRSVRGREESAYARSRALSKRSHYGDHKAWRAHARRRVKVKLADSISRCRACKGQEAEEAAAAAAAKTRATKK
jgi:hypothetical protein